MKTISLHVAEQAYEEFKSLSSATGRPVAELIRQAMSDYLDARRKQSHSILDIEAYKSGPLLESWSRSEVYDEMIGS